MTKFQTQQGLGRAKNAIQDHLIRKLLIPKVYLDALWGGVWIDVLAFDRAGVGDVHGVRIVWEGTSADIENAIETVVANVDPSENGKRLSEADDPLIHFRYAAVVCDQLGAVRFSPSGGSLQRMLAEKDANQKLLANDGVGRLGVLFVDLTGDTPFVSAILEPERFRSSKEIVERADRYVAEHTANWEIRE